MSRQKQRSMISKLELLVLDCARLDGVLLECPLSQEVSSQLRRFSDSDFGSILAHDPHLSGTNSNHEKQRRISELIEDALKLNSFEKCISLLITAVAALLQFLKRNFIGPITGDFECVCSSGVLGLDGEDVVGKLNSPELLLLSRLILLEPLGIQSSVSKDSDSSQNEAPELITKKQKVFDFINETCPSWLWWTGRVAYFHQKFLKHNSVTLRIEIMTIMETLQKQFLDTTDQSLNTFYQIKLSLEFAQWELLYRRIQSANEYVTRVERLLGTKIEVVGAMGTRTVHQVDPKAQLTARLHRQEATPGQQMDSEIITDPGYEMDLLCSNDSDDDVLSRPKWVDGESETTLSVPEQCLVLARSDLLELGTANDALKSWEMEPYIHFVLSQNRSTFIIQSKAALCQIRHEKDRNRTRERAYQSLEHLMSLIQHRSGISCTLDWSIFCTKFPTTIQLRIETSQLQIAFGEVSRALTTFEELELWDELVLCYQLLHKTTIADAIVTSRLELAPDHPRLLCTLGDLRSSPELYREAWVASRGTYPRAQRSLGRYYLTKGVFQSASESFELALKLNTLHPDIWFSLGYCYLKLARDEAALKAFTRCVQLDDGNGEAWNNLGAIWMRKKEPKRALWALKEAVKHKFGNWETWENYSRAALAARELPLTLHGLNMVLQLTDGNRMKREILIPLFDGLLEMEKTKENAKLMNKGLELLNKASVASSWDIEVWILLSRVHKWSGDLNSAKETLKKCFRNLHGSEWKTNFDKFKLMIDVLERLVCSYKEGNTSSADFTSLNLQIKSITKQAKQVFETCTNELTQLETLLKETQIS
eukprot:g8113.t1